MFNKTGLVGVNGVSVPLESGFSLSLVEGRVTWHFSLPNKTTSSYLHRLTDLHHKQLLHLWDRWIF